ncbi:MAG: ATP-dependent DNA ligase [Candidatus Aenigmarchaeota archaeon]|nr:ATP-dependent DNA ligase [Candidatus Aenigmarchaeota archaeon]
MKKLAYVIQEHHATHLHYDLRLEMDGVLKSWAIPKKPIGRGKRLAIQVNDHDLSYKDFEGVIESGYGAGTVKIWDKGWYELIEKTKDKILIELHGKKLKGKYALVRFKKSGKKNYLFFKVSEKR